MSTENANSGMMLSREAGADLSAKQFYAVKWSSGKIVACAGTTDIPIGILQNKPTSGETAKVCVFGLTKVNSDAALAQDDLIGTSADGQLATYVNGTDTTKYIIGRVVIASAAAAGYATAFINCVDPHRGA